MLSGFFRAVPAYDITFAYKVGGRFIGDHQLMINGKLGNDAEFEDFRQIAEQFSIKDYRSFIHEVANARRYLREKMESVGVSKGYTDMVMGAIGMRNINEK